MSWRAKLNNWVSADKLKADKNLPPSYTIYEPMTARVIPLDEVQSFIIYETNEQTLIMIEEQGFKLEQLDGNWWMCRRNKG